MVDIPKVVQAFALQIYTQVIDTVQQLDPLPADALESHEQRLDNIFPDVSAWLMALTAEDLTLIVEGHEPEKRLNGHDHPGYPADAVQLVLEKRIRAASDVCMQADIDFHAFIHLTGKYLSSMDDHKKAWLAERAANLLVAGA